MSDIKRNKYGTPDSWKRIVNDRDVDDPYRASYDDEDWLADLKDQYRKRAKDESDKWVKDHNDDFFKEGEDMINLEDEYYGKANEGHDAWNADPHTDDIRKRWGQADAYYNVAKKKGWRGTAAKQKGLVDKLSNEYEDYKKSFVDNYIGQDLNDRWNNRKHPMMDELNTINSNIEKEFKKAVRDKRKSFETALNGRQIYAGMTGQGADKKWDFFLENPSDDPNAPKTYKRIGQRRFNNYPWGPNRGWEEHMAYPDPTQEFDDVAAPDIDYLQKHSGLNDYKKIGERDSTD